MVLELDNLNRCIFDDFNEDAEQLNRRLKKNANRGNIVKHTLKSKILERRQSLGLGKITVDFSSKKSYPMTEEEIEKDRRRKQSNRNSAQRCRQKQKEEDERNKKLLVRLKEDHENLVNNVKEMEEERNKVLFALKNVLPDSYILEALSRIDRHEILRNKSACRKAESKISKTPEQTEELGNEMQAITANDLILDQNYLFEDDSASGEILLSSLINGVEGERSVVESLDILETENVDSLQFYFLQ